MPSQSPRPLAVVTGASSGIGLELARQFAVNGYDLIVAAEDAELEVAAVELRGAGGVEIEAVRVDLSSDEGVDELYERISSGGRPVAAIALNAGIGMSGPFVETDLAQELTLIDLNCRSTIHLAKHVVADMVQRNEGRVLFTSSIASTMPAGYEAVYAASKSFVQSFALALRNELKETEVTVTSLMPGPTDTEFWDRAGATDTRLGASDAKDDPAEVARMGFEAMTNGDERVIASSVSSKAQGRMSRVMPDSLKAAMYAKQAEPGSAAAWSSAPIKVSAHSLIDYGLAALSIGAPAVLGLDGAARAIPVGWGLTQGALNAVTDQPYALKRLVSFKNHGRIESVGVPALAATVLATGAYRGRVPSAFFGGLFATLGTVYALTDWSAGPPR